MTVLIEDLRFETILGILEHERRIPQSVRVDCILEYVYETGHYVNYAEVAEEIRMIMQHGKFELIEEALETLAQTLKENFPLLDRLNLSIRKPDILPNCTVGVQKNFIF